MLPKSIQVCGVKYKIKHMDFNPDLMGLCDKGRKIIYISKSNCKTEQEMIETLGHELVHAYFCERDFDVVVHHKVEELICLSMEKMLLNMIPTIFFHRKKLGG